MPPAVTRGRTTKNCVSARRKSSACLLSSAVTMMPLRSELSVIVLTTPISTSLYLIFVLPASSPSAVLNSMVITGPRSRMARTASHPPTSTATIGMIQTSWKAKRFRGTATASGSWDDDSGSAMLFLHRVPDQARIEGLSREHRDHHHRPERDGARPGLDAHEPSELHEGGEERGDVDVDHGPAADDLEDPVELRAPPGRQREALPNRQEKIGQGDGLGDRHRDARDEEDDRQRLRAVPPQEDDAAHDGVRLRAEKRAVDHNGEDVGGNDQNV